MIKTEKPNNIGNPDLNVGSIHKVRIMRDIDRGPYGIYKSQVLEVYPTMYREKVFFPKTSDRAASERVVNFQKSDYRHGIGSCNLEGKSEED